MKNSRQKQSFFFRFTCKILKIFVRMLVQISSPKGDPSKNSPKSEELERILVRMLVMDFPSPTTLL